MVHPGAGEQRPEHLDVLQPIDETNPMIQMGFQRCQRNLHVPQSCCWTSCEQAFHPGIREPFLQEEAGLSLSLDEMDRNYSAHSTNLREFHGSLLQRDGTIRSDIQPEHSEFPHSIDDLERN